MDNISAIKNHVEVVHSTSIQKVYTLIKDVKSPHREKVEEIRKLYASGAAGEADKLKKELMGFTCSGIFKKRRVTKNLASYSGLLILDLDDLNPPRLKEVKSIIEFIPYTYICFTSPSGFGLKVVVKVDSEAANHKDAYAKVKEYYEDEIGEKFDKTCDVARLTYISYDPEAYLNTNSAVFHVDVVQKKLSTDISVSTDNLVNDGNASFQVAVQFTEKTSKFENGSRNNFLHQLACNCNRYAIRMDQVIDLCIDRYGDGWDAKEIQDVITGVYSRHLDQFGAWSRYLNRKLPKMNDQLSITGSDHSNTKEDEVAIDTPIIPEYVVDRLPDMIKSIALKLSSDRERDTFITGALTILSGCLYSVKAIYDGSIVYPNINSFIIAPASSGKGVMKLARELGENLHTKLLKESQEAILLYKQEMELYKEAKRKGNDEMEKPEKPPFTMLFVPGNSSSAAIYDHLNDCDGIGIVCETEADTVNNCLKNDWGNYSDLLRKAFHHEVVSCRRKTDEQYIEINSPRLSVALSSTVSQVQKLIHSAEDGLFSRFIFYKFHIARRWRDVSPANGKADIPKLVSEKAKEVTAMVNFLSQYPSEFDLTEKQWNTFNKQFEKWLNSVSCFVTEEAGASVMRLGLCTFRIAMILSAIRKYETKTKDVKLLCTDEHFEMAIRICDVYLQHALIMYKELPVTSKVLDGKLKIFFEKLTMEFTRDMAKTVAMEAGLNVSESWVDKWLKRLVGYGYLIKPEYNIYRKIQTGTINHDGPENNDAGCSVMEIAPVTGKAIA